jgi:hypothetical protein
MSHDKSPDVRLKWTNKVLTQWNEYKEESFQQNNHGIDILMLKPEEEFFALLQISKVVRVANFQNTADKIRSEIESRGRVMGEDLFGKHFVDRSPKEASLEREFNDTLPSLRELFTQTQRGLNEYHAWNLGVCITTCGDASCGDAFSTSFPTPSSVVPNRLLYLVSPAPTKTAPLTIRLDFETEDVVLTIDLFTGDGFCIEGM